jgi:hypothetical protein
MEEFKLVLNFQKEIGFGQQFGCFHKIMNMDNGQHQEKSISLNQEEIVHLVKPVELTNLDQLFTLDLDILMMHGKKLMQSILTLQI